MTVRCESAKEEVSVQVSLVVSSSKSRVAATWLGGVDCDVASRQSSSSRIRLGWRHPRDLAGGAAVSTSTRCDRPLHSVLGTGWEASCVKTASILVDAEGRTALVPDLLAGRKKPPFSIISPLGGTPLSLQTLPVQARMGLSIDRGTWQLSSCVVGSRLTCSVRA